MSRFFSFFNALEAILIFVFGFILATEQSNALSTAIDNVYCKIAARFVSVPYTCNWTVKNYLAYLVFGMFIVLFGLSSFNRIKWVFREAKLFRKLQVHRNHSASIIEDALENLCQSASLKSTERVSLYWFDRTTKDFEIIARYSSHQINGQIRRERFGKRGFIWEAYDQDKTVSIVDLPDHKLGFLSYWKNVKPSGVSIFEVFRQRMRSRSYYVRRLNDKNGRDLPLVIVFESSKPQGVTAAILDPIFTNLSGDFVYLMHKFCESAKGG